MSGNYKELEKRVEELEANQKLMLAFLKDLVYWAESSDNPLRDMVESEAFREISLMD